MTNSEILFLYLALLIGNWLYGLVTGRPFNVDQAYHQGTALLTMACINLWRST